MSRAQLIGRATNGGFGFRVNKSLALAMVKPEHAATGHRARDQDPWLQLFKATVIAESPYDPDNVKLRA
jgi:dimethylglycine dehydrogenase